MSAITLSPSQEKIISAMKNRNSGHMVVIAGAGCGKTFTIIHGLNAAPERYKGAAAFNVDIKDELAARVAKGVDARTLGSIGNGALWYVRKDQNLEVDKHVTWDRARIAVHAMKAECQDPEAWEWLDNDAEKLVVKVADRVKNTRPWAETIDEVGQVIDGMSWEITLPELFNECQDYPACGSGIHGFDEFGEPVKCPNCKFDNDYYKDLLSVMVLDTMQQAIDNFNNATKRGDTIKFDFTDQVWLPVRLKLARKRWDLLVVDEAQDMSFTQLELAIMSCRGRLVIVGDPRQAIYGFRGADSRAMSRMMKRLNAKEFPLMESRRCPTEVVRWANQFVPEFQAHPDNPKGIVDTVSEGEMISSLRIGDVVISRVNAPLMAICLKLIAKGVRAMVAGKQVGEALVKLLDKVEGKKPFRDKDDMWIRLREWAEREKKKIVEACQRRGGSEIAIDKEIAEQCEPIGDKLEIFKTMIQHLPNPKAVKKALADLFLLNKNGEAGESEEQEKKNLKLRKKDYVICTSIHKAKGLEWERVFVLGKTLKTNTEEERNLCYVAGTRAMRELYFTGIYDPFKMIVPEGERNQAGDSNPGELKIDEAMAIELGGEVEESCEGGCGQVKSKCQCDYLKRMKTPPGKQQEAEVKAPKAPAGGFTFGFGDAFLTDAVGSAPEDDEEEW